jgi:lipopolysaccharide/colanic/teichoic acid biosynthesis glycosyltransferase
MTSWLLPPGISVAKRLFDLCLSLALLVLLSPFLLAIYSLVLFFHGTPALFRQARPGYRGRPFTLLKFRTMREALDAAGEPLPDSQRVTRFGRFLRSLSLDELPELVNILRGEMSMVGPRPLLMQYLPRYSAEQARRHEVLPGITGWAQVNGRNDLSWEDKFRLDVWYVDHWSFWLDLRILGLTFIKTLQRQGISQEGYISSEEFMGSDDEHDSLHR